MKVLIFQSKRLSYDSSWCFAEMLCRSMKRQGISVRPFLLSEDIAGQEEELRALTREHFDGIFDINSRLPNVMLDDRYYLDYFDAPFFHMIIDHPMHLHYSLQIPLRNYYVLCLDRYHQKYIETCYPHIREAIFFPFAGIPADTFTPGNFPRSPMKDRPVELLFPGTYTPLDYYREQMEDISSDQWEMTEHILSKLRHGSRNTIEQLYRQEILPDTDFFPLRMHKSRLIDRYIREWFREKILQALLEAGICVHVMGFRWEMYDTPYSSGLVIHPPCSYTEQLNALTKSKLILNVQPLFQDGPHDRVMNAMMNRSVAVTDGCDYISEQFRVGEDLIVYDKNKPEEAAMQILKLLKDTDRIEWIAENGYQKTQKLHTWDQRIQKFVRKNSHLFH